jgi:hypothetical protein
VDPHPIAEKIVSVSASAGSIGGQTGVMYGAGALAAKALRTPWTTPQRLVAFRTLTWVLAGLLLFVGETTLSRGRSAFRAIAKQSAPNIVAAAQIGGAFADLDANVANALLGNSAHRAAAEALIEKHRASVSDGLVNAAQNITYGDAEKIPIRAMSVDFGRYLERQAEARLLHDRGEEVAARGSYWDATALLHDKLLASVDQLDKANKSEMDSAYNAQLAANEGAEDFAILAGCLLIGALVWTQCFMLRRMRRMINVPLALATLATVCFTFYLVGCFVDVRDDLRIAKTDAFDSIYALVRARAIAYDANGDESRYLLDSSPLHGIDREFRRKVDQLTGSPILSAAAKADLGASNTKIPGMLHKSKIGGALWDEVRNITFDGEYLAASEMLNAFSTYYSVDSRIRALKQSGKDTDAVELCAGNPANGSKVAFDAFDKALQKTLDINQAAFDQATARAEAELKRAEIVDPGFAIFLALLAWLGVRARLREYAA